MLLTDLFKNISAEHTVCQAREKKSSDRQFSFKIFLLCFRWWWEPESEWCCMGLHGIAQVLLYKWVERGKENVALAVIDPESKVQSRLLNVLEATVQQLEEGCCPTRWLIFQPVRSFRLEKGIALVTLATLCYVHLWKLIWMVLVM